MAPPRKRDVVRLIAAQDEGYRSSLAADLCSLFKSYLSKVSEGPPEAFTTLRQAWQQACFSFTFAVCSPLPLLPASCWSHFTDSQHLLCRPGRRTCP